MSRVLHGQAVAPSQIRKVVQSLGLSINQETVHDFLILCPFHYNDNTPSMSLSKKDGRFICFNPSCGATGDIMRLVRNIKKYNDAEAMRFMINNASISDADITSEVEKSLDDNVTFKEFPHQTIDRLHSSLNDESLQYLAGRGFNRETIDEFLLGYSEKQGLVTVPVYSHTDIPVGLVGRSITGKRFKNSPKLPGSKVFFNLNKAMRLSSSVIITESSFDAMLVHQAGYPNAIATLGGYVSPFKMNLLNMYFDSIVIMTDNDDAGRKLGSQIASGFRREVHWVLYPDGVKDAGDMTEEQIRWAINNSITDVEYEIMV